MLDLRASARLVSVAIGMALATVVLRASAQVSEPNGTAVPVMPTPGNTAETTLQQYFDGLGETIDARTEASTDPGAFSPLCDFEAQLVLSQSQGSAGIAWYNVPANANDAPSAWYQVIAPTATVGTGLTSASIRGNPNYTGGLIGFALIEGGVPVFYSEYQRNQDCTACVTPGRWKMSLTYKSKIEPNTFYLAFEDWCCGNASMWPDDGDFNDKVFKITGVACQGGGVPCDTMKPGVCSTGLTECQFGGTLSCKQQIAEGAEKCDGYDNDCNGLIDDGDALCKEDEVCVQGNCVKACSNLEFPCAAALVCDNGYCVDAACVGIICAAGQTCRAGKCVGACDGVTCPVGQECRVGHCVKPCEGVTCGAGEVCEHGICLSNCGCRVCEGTKACAPAGNAAAGTCVDPGCDSMTCSAGNACVAGACVDACQGATCPGGATCSQGVCGDPIPGAVSGSPSDGGVVIIGSGGAAGAGAGTGTGASTGTGDAGSGTPLISGRKTTAAGCSCRLVPRAGRSHAALALGLLCGLCWRRRGKGRKRFSVRD
jgi:hypothetical protein